MAYRAILLGGALAASLCGAGLAQQSLQQTNAAVMGSPGMQEGEGHYQNAPGGQRVQYARGAPCQLPRGGPTSASYSSGVYNRYQAYGSSAAYQQNGSNGLTPARRLPNCNPLGTSARGGGRVDVGNGVHTSRN